MNKNQREYMRKRGLLKSQQTPKTGTKTIRQALLMMPPSDILTEVRMFLAQKPIQTKVVTLRKNYMNVSIGDWALVFDIAEAKGTEISPQYIEFVQVNGRFCQTNCRTWKELETAILFELED